MPRPSLEPKAVVTVDLSADFHVTGLRGLGPHAIASALVRMDRMPVGYVDIPLTDGACPADTVKHAVLGACESGLVRRLVADSILTPPANDAWPSMTVAICTRNRPDDLRQCLETLRASPGHEFEVLVIDNAPSDDRTARLVQAQPSKATYDVEPRPGLSWARRRAIDLCRTDVIAFVDDDVRVDGGWAEAVRRSFAADADVGAVLGFVAPAELETEAQAVFEEHGGFARGFARRWHRRRAGRTVAPALANTGTLGAGANMAFRRSVVTDIGSFDVALGAGTPTGGGEDLDILFRVLKAGQTIAYEPAAVVRHRHRRDMHDLEAQVTSWCQGMTAYLARAGESFADERPGLRALANGLRFGYYPRRMAQALVDPRIRWSLAVAEYRGALRGRSRLQEAKARLRADGLSADPPAFSVRRHEADGGATVEVVVDVDRQMPDVSHAAHGADRLSVLVRRGGTAIGHFELVTGGHPPGPRRLVEEIVTRIEPDLIDAGRARAIVRNALRTRSHDGRRPADSVS